MTSDAPDASVAVVDLLTFAQGGAASTAWAYGEAQLNANLRVLAEAEGGAAHVNNAVDVLRVGIVGQGVITVRWTGTSRQRRAGAGDGERRTSRPSRGGWSFRGLHLPPTPPWSLAGRDTATGSEL